MLILLFFFVGIQLCNNGMILKQIVFNCWGMIVVVVVVVSLLIGGLINVFIFDFFINIVLVMVFGFGWYFFFGILLIEFFGLVIGSVVFFNDLVCELIVIMLISGLICCSCFIVLGLCGVILMDFILFVF